ncbi:MAG: ThuA domain-containing protein, partial [Candidatus Solibacter usitatus]|nr:ThuA domain-containing protein [Candidatus Solibacter usitatus]
MRKIPHLLLAALLGAPLVLAQGPLQVLILSGRNNHDWRASTPFLRKLLQDTQRFDVRVVEEPSGITAAALAGYHVAVSDYNGPRWGETAETALASFVRSGKGLAVVHGASYAFGGLQVLGDRHVRTGIFEPSWPEYARMTGARWSEQAPKSGHGQRHAFQVKFVDREHPIAAGRPDTFLTSDELYHNLRMQPGARILATAYDAPEIGGTGKDEPVLWTVAYGTGRVFHTTLGHDLSAMQSAGFRATFVHGVEWAATGKVKIPVNPPPAGAVKVQVVTGGHDFAASFYGLFDGYADISAQVQPHPGVFRRDFRQSADVLVLYDLIEKLDDAQKQNLRAFLESAKGMVVLHHALADNQDWPWWYQDVTGGRYLLKPEGSSAASTFQHDVDLLVRPARSHPITAGLGPILIQDE